MILFIIGALFVLIALAILIFSDDAKRTAIIPAVVAVIFIGISCVSYVPTGYTGIVTTFGKVEDGTKDAGVVFKAPWQSIVKMDIRCRTTQKQSCKNWLQCWQKLTSVNRKNRNRRSMI